jgi:hypothetical protein
VEKSPQRFIVNEAFVRQFLRGERPLGKKIQALMEPENPFGEVIGVVGDVREWSIDHEPIPPVYYTYSQLSFTSMTFMVRAERNPLILAEPARRIIRGLDPAQPIAEVRTMEDILGENFARQRFSAWLLSGFSIVALVLAGSASTASSPAPLRHVPATRRAGGAGLIPDALSRWCLKRVRAPW